ncbi:ion transporter [Salinigranum rubrum]|uniref:Ion transporter n=1 Tax=Salinigranum rubrum TaxID=755307 RepID=A0A2I8VMG3_9EURY|nr:potassium channel family protein [Salinigranum rubrum]AUV83127.1 ion transporter [Salinigranum rubrum]
MDGGRGHGATRTYRDTVRFYLIDHRTTVGKGLDIALLGLNLLFIALFVADTYPLAPAQQAALWAAEVAIATVFLVEYLLRVYGARSRLAEVTNPYTVVDLLAILPTFAVLAGATLLTGAAGLGVLRLLRVVRVLRFFRFTRDEEFFFGSVSVETLRVMKLLMTVVAIFFVAAGLFYEFEYGVNERVSTFGDAFYFTVVTLTTVGFGDITPTTRAGRLVTIAAILAGVILIPWQASKIVREWAHRDMRNVTCPECGLEYHDADASHCKACGHVIYQRHDSRE